MKLLSYNKTKRKLSLFKYTATEEYKETGGEAPCTLNLDLVYTTLLFYLCYMFQIHQTILRHICVSVKSLLHVSCNMLFSKDY
jgi:hypothetical protein